MDLNGISGLQRVRWEQLKPGMIYVGGLLINDLPPPELRVFPVLTHELLNELTCRYRLQPNREVLIANAVPGYGLKNVSDEIKEANEALGKINRFRAEYFNERQNVFRKFNVEADQDSALLEAFEFTEQEYLVRDLYNSFTVPYKRMPEDVVIPSFFNRAELRMTLGDLLSGRLNSKYNLPADKEVLLHLVVDYSFSMDSHSKHDIVVSALNYFYSHIIEFLLNTKMRLYVFSDECRVVEYPLSGSEIKRGETNYSAFIKKVLHHKDTAVHNKVILFTDGQPSDQSDALRLAALLKKNRIDYTQIIFNLAEEMRMEVDGADPDDVVDGHVIAHDGLEHIELTDEELEAKKKRIFVEFTELARVAGGNQILLKIDELSRLISVECYDRYLGLLTLATRKEISIAENQREVTDQRIRKWEFER